MTCVALSVATLLSKGQFNVSGGCGPCGVNQQDTIVLIELTSWCLLNRHVGVDQTAFNSKDHLQVLERCSKREPNNC